MSEMEINCSQTRDLLSSSLVRETTDKHDGVDKHLKECSSCNAWSDQMNEIVTVASSMAQFDVPESLTQSILKAVDAQAVQRKSLSPSLMIPAVFALLMAVILVIETHESIGGVISWAAGLAVMYSVSLLVSSNKEAEPA
ncbi:MAG: hypothetical protein IT342_11885 [Candidatus Melainabacteria bacterium]|nr:hypothetical protein [Candidatus Melainabacteria bacterium]